MIDSPGSRVVFYTGNRWLKLLCSADLSTLWELTGESGIFVETTHIGFKVLNGRRFMG
jgi:hypothetical protein